MTEENITLENYPFTSVMNLEKDEAVYFKFEEDFVEENIRCIPMCVRFKLDACGIKLQLREWSKMSVAERNNLAEMSCITDKAIRKYRSYLKHIIFNHTGKEATELLIEQNPAWNNVYEIPQLLIEKLKEFDWIISLRQWRELSNLQRFVLMKLCKPGHENKNFPKAIKEFGLA